MKPKTSDDDVNFFDLNPNRLDQEWLKQSSLYHRFAVKLADAREVWERAKAHRDVTEAEVELEVRRNPLKFDLEKVTEGAVRMTVMADKRYQAAVAGVIKAKHDVDVLEAAVAALDHRKKALENLVQLRLRDYYSDPKAPPDAELLTNARSFKSFVKK